MKEKLDIKIGTKTQALWEKVRKESKILIEQHTESLQIQKEILKLAESIIKAEETK